MHFDANIENIFDYTKCVIIANGMVTLIWLEY